MAFAGALSGHFLRLYALTLLYFSGNAIMNVLIPLRGESLGANNAAIGVIMGAYLFTTMLFRPWAGRWIQRFGPIRVLRSILLLNALALVMYTFTGLEGYFVARVLQGGCTAFFSMALQLGIIDALPEKDRSQGISMYSLCSYMPGIFGPLLALGLWKAGDSQGFTIVMIALAVGTGAAGFSVRMDRAGAVSVPSQQETVSMARSFGELFQNPHLLRCSILMLTASIVFGAVTTFVPLYAEQVKYASAGVFLMVQTAVIVVSRFALRKKIPSDGKWHSSYLMGMMLVMTVAAQSISWSAMGGVGFFYAGAALMGIAQALLYPTLMTYLTFVLPQASRNVLIGLFIATADLGVSMGAVLMGPIADATSYSFVYTVCALLGASMIGFAYKRNAPQ